MIDIGLCRLVGVAAKPLGNKGKLQIKLDENCNTGLLNKCNSVFLFIDGLLVPFRIDEIEVLSKTAMMQLNTIDTVEKAQKLRNCQVYMPAQNPKRTSSRKSSGQSDLIGFAVYDKNAGFVGHITGFNLIPENPLFEIDNNGTQILVPAHDDFIEAVDDQNSMILINMPEGFFDIF